MGLRPKVLGVGVGLTKLKTDDGVKELISYLDSIFKQDHFVVLYNLHKKFEDYRRDKSETIEQYISCFEALVLQMEQKNMKYPEVIKAFKLLEGSRVSELEKKMIVSSVKYENNEANLYRDMKNSLKKNAGEVKTLGRLASDKKVNADEVEVLAAQNSEAFAAAGFKKAGGRRRSWSDPEADGYGKSSIRRCFHCSSPSHFRNECEEYIKLQKLKKENSKKEKVIKDDKSKGDKDSSRKVKKKTLTLFTKNEQEEEDSNMCLVFTIDSDEGTEKEKDEIAPPPPPDLVETKKQLNSESPFLPGDSGGSRKGQPLGHDCSSLLPGDSGGSRKGQSLGHLVIPFLPGDSGGSRKLFLSTLRA